MYPQYQQPVYYGSQYSGCLKFILYVLSFFMPIVGIIVGLIFMSRPDPESKSLGQTCLIISIASMVLWFLWILWHIPFQLGGYWNAELGDFIRSLLGSFFARFIFTWLFNKTRGGILTAIVFHVSANVSFMFLPATPVHMILEAMVAVVIIVAGQMWEKLPSNHPGVYSG